MTASRPTALTRATVWVLVVAVGGALFYALIIFGFYSITNPGPNDGYQDTFDYGFGVLPALGGFVAIGLLVAACALAPRRPVLTAILALATPPLVAATLATQADYLRHNSYTAHYVLWRVIPPYCVLTTSVGLALVLLLIDTLRRTRLQGRADKATRSGEVSGT